MTGAAAASRRHLYAALVVFALIAGFLIWASTLDRASGLVPVLVGWLGVVLCGLDVIAHTPTRLGHLVGAVLSGTAHFEAAEEEDRAGGAREATAVLWMLGGLVLIVLLGFLVGAPLYIVAYMLVRGRKSLRASLAAALLTSLFIWLVFDYLMQYEVYRGILFGDYAFGLS